MKRTAAVLAAIGMVLIPSLLAARAPEARPRASSALPMMAVAQQISPGPAADGEVAGYEDNREPAGRLEDGTLRVSLEARAAGWRPWGEDGPSVRAHVFAVEGAGAKVPGPLLRVTAGTPLHVTIRNSLGDTLLVRGLVDRGRDLPPGVSPGPALVTLPFVGDSLVVAPGEAGEVRFTPTVPGSYYYFGRTMEPGWSSTPGPVPLGGWPEAVSFYGENAPDRALVGVLIVDAPGEVPDPEERIFLISHWADRDDPGTWVPSARFLINGRAWPHTERLVYAQGDTVRWRVINQSGGFHPMHLHGFYFHVDAWAGQDGRSPLAPGERPLVVTWGLPPTTAMRLSWVAHEPGNWVFHCHLMRHMSWMQHPVFGGDAAAHQHGSGEGVDLMGGLVLGITIEPDEGWSPAVVSARRQLRLHIGKRDGVFDDEPGYGFVLQEGSDPPAPDSVRFPGSPIVLNRGEPAEIVVHNHADVALGVHWHGLELESWADGVPGWSGMPGNLIPAISPADSLVVRMTPPRAGTFMYHVHSEPGHQLAQGLYGPFLVLEPGESWNPETDRLFLLASLGAGENPPPAINGQVEPGPMEFVAGSTYRLRFMHVSPDDNKSIRLRAGNEPAEWRVIARDGADLPPSRVVTRAADVPRFDVGSTFDVVWTPVRPDDMTLRIVTTFDAGLTVFPSDDPPPHTMDIPVMVRSADVAIRGATVVDMTSGSLVPDQTVLIAGNRIVAVGPTDEVGIAPGADLIDAAGGYLIPGLWDMHVHSVRKASAVVEEGVANEDWHFPLFLAYGVTGVRNMNDATADPTLELTNSVKRRLTEGELVGPRLLAPGPFVDGDPPLVAGAVVVRTAAEARAVVDSLADAGADFIKPYENLSREAYFAIMDQARRRGIPVDGHLPFRVTAEEAAAAGQRTVEHPEVMAAGCSTDAETVRERFARVFSDEYDNLPEDEQFLVQFRLYRAFYDTRDPAACEAAIEAFRRHGVAVTVDVVAYHHVVHAAEILADTASLRLVPHAVRRTWEGQAGGDMFHAFQSILRPIIPLELENVRLLHEAGVTLLAATDVGVPLQVPGISLHRQLLRLTEAGLTPLEALRTATLNPARVLGLADSLGTIEAGKLADLVLLDANPLADIRNTQRIRAVIADGRLYRRADLDRLLAKIEGLESTDRERGEDNR